MFSINYLILFLFFKYSNYLKKKKISNESNYFKICVKVNRIYFSVGVFVLVVGVEEWVF